MESRYGKDTLQKELLQNRNKVIEFNKTVHRPVVDTTATDYMQLLNANSYEKGGWVLHMLHRQLGDTIFWKAIRTYYNTYSGKNASTDDLRRIFENVSGKDLKRFFQQWLYISGHPVLQVTHRYTDKVLTVTIVQQQDYVFEFPLTVIMKTAGEDFTKSTIINKKTTTFSLPMENGPTDIVIDPFTSLLFEPR
jgi:aminopeptidase N